MRYSYNAVLMLMLLLLTPGVACAQATPAAPEAVPTVAPNAANDNGAKPLMKFAANNDEFDRTITEKAEDYYHRQITECQSIDQMVRQLPSAYGALTFPLGTATIKFPAPINGLWVEHVKIRGCDQIFQINMLAIAQNIQGKNKLPEPPLIYGILPGETQSDPSQTGNVIHMAGSAIRRADASCADDAKPYYTKLLGYKQADGSLAKTDARLGWFEQWTFKFCQKTIPVQIAFIPDGDGGYDIKTRIVSEKPPATPEAKPAVPAAATPVEATPAPVTPAAEIPAAPAPGQQQKAAPSAPPLQQNE